MHSFINTTRTRTNSHERSTEIVKTLCKGKSKLDNIEKYCHQEYALIGRPSKLATLFHDPHPLIYLTPPLLIHTIHFIS